MRKMLDIKLIRENPEYVKNNLMKRGNPENSAMLDELVDVDREWRQKLTKLNDLRHERKMLTVEIGKLKKTGKDAGSEVEKAKTLDSEITCIQAEVVRAEEKTSDYLMRLPNLLHDTVPVGEDENDNVQVKSWGVIQRFGFPSKNHIDLGLNLDIIDIERAGKVAGSRFFYLKREGVLLDMALMNFALEEITKKGYLPVEPPYLMRRESYEGVTALDDFEEVLYKIENEDLYLIATSEHPMAAMFMKEVLKEEDLPLKLAGISACFRKEAGTSGKDTKGIFRVHQFNKVEQFVFSHPDESWKIHEELNANIEEFFQKLEIPYRVVNVCTGDIGIVAAKKYDLEAWMPGQERYREAGSCSNCTAYRQLVSM